MERFATLLNALILTPSRNGKLGLLTEYFAEVPDPERGWAVAAGERFRVRSAPGVRITVATLDPEDTPRLAGDIADVLGRP